LDHDFTSLHEGKAIPHGIYDDKHKQGFITVGSSKDTSEFACDCIKSWWKKIGMFLYPLAKCILILCDGGGSNSSRHFIFKEDLEKTAKELGIDIRIAHYPPYCSKWNPIEHRLFPFVSKALRGANYTSIDKVVQSISRTKTKTGLRVIVNKNEKTYQTGRKYKKGYKQNMKIVFDEFLPKWNYTAKASA